MKEFINKLIGRLEELRKEYYEDYNTYKIERDLGNVDGLKHAISIVNELAEEFDGEELRKSQKIYNYIKQEINPYGKPFDGTVYEFGLKVMKYIENLHTEELAEEYINTSTDTSSGWIPCSERLPKEKGEYLVTLIAGQVTSAIYDLNENKWVDAMEEYFEYPCIAWQPLPQPYKPQKIEWKDKVMKHFTKTE